MITGIRRQFLLNTPTSDFLKNHFSGSAVRPVVVKTDGATDEPMAVLIDLCRNSKPGRPP